MLVSADPVGMPETSAWRWVLMLTAHIVRRQAAAAAMSERFAAAASPGQGGAVRELLQGSYPRLANLLEDALKRIHAETQVQPDQT